MKKELSILMIMFYSLAFSQFIKHEPPSNEWDIYPETNIRYSNGKEDLKEILTLQSLLAEDRIDEMFEMMGKFGYILFGENLYCKNPINNDITENEIEPVIILKNFGGNKKIMYYENYLQVLFSLTIKTDKGIERIVRVNYKQAAQMRNIVLTLFPMGNPYNSLKNFFDEKLEMGEDTTMEWVDRYTVKINNPLETTIYKVSNFSPLPPMLKEKEGYKTYIFEGPGKAESTHILFKNFSNNSDDKGKYLVPNLLFFSSISDIFKTFKPESREPFNIDFFMSLENFNDRIWRDK